MRMTRRTNAHRMTEKDRIGLYLRRRFLTFLSVLAGCSVVAYMAFAMLITGQDRLASLVNDVGRQRMLAMRIAATTLRLPEAPTEKREALRGDLLRDLTAMQALFAALPERAVESRLSGVVEGYLEQAPHDLNGTFADFRGRVLALSRSDAPARDEVKAVVDMASGRLITGLEALLAALEHGGQSAVRSVQALATIGEGVYLLLLLGLGARVLWPLSRDVQDNVRQILDLESFQRSIVDGLADGLIHLRHARRLGEPLNPAARSIFGLAGDQDMMLTMLIPDMATAREEDLLTWTRREVDGMRLDGTPLHLEITVRRVAQERLVAVVRDVTEARENAVRVRNFYHVLEQAPVSVVITDAEGHIEYVNPQLCQSTGYTPDEVIGRKPSIFKSGQTPEDVYRNLWDALSHGRQWRCEMLNKRKNGELFWEFQAISPLRDSRGRITQYVAVKEDITEQKEWQRSLVQAMENARRASQAKSDFLAGMSHELRTPLNAVIGYSELAMLQPWGPLGDPRYQEYLGAVNDSGRHLLDLINDLLDLSKVEADRLELNEEEVDVSDLIEKTDLLVREQAGKRGVALHYDLPQPAPRLYADPLRLKQVLLNLLSNALKFSEAGTEVRVTVQGGEGEDLRLAVVDQGRGIRQEDLERVMEPFAQAHDPRVRQEVGTGLGLPLSRKLVELHGGSMTLASVYGRGTTVTVRLPASRVVQRAPSGRSASLVG